MRRSRVPSITWWEHSVSGGASARQTRPLTGSSAPVTALPASLARKRITSASSFGATHLAGSAFGMLARFAAVSMIEGSTAFTVILPFSSAASELRQLVHARLRRRIRTHAGAGLQGPHSADIDDAGRARIEKIRDRGEGSVQRRLDNESVHALPGFGIAVGNGLEGKSAGNIDQHIAWAEMRRRGIARKRAETSPFLECRLDAPPADPRKGPISRALGAFGEVLAPGISADRID